MREETKVKQKEGEMKVRKFNKLSDKDIVVYSLYLLDGWQKRVHTEDIALKCYELAPNRFSWVKYPQYPDLTPARFALESTKKSQYGALVKGESERKKTIKSVGGWMLTASGIQWIKINKARIEKYLDRQVPIGDRLPGDRKLKELLGSAAFKKFTGLGERAEISHAEFAESLICTVNTGAEVLNDRLEQLYSIAEKLKREEVKKYVDFCRKRFASLLGGKGGVKNAKE
jgi:hypothetical protein